MNFPVSPEVKTPRFHFRGCRFNPWSGNLDPACWATKKRNFLELNKNENTTCQLKKIVLKIVKVFLQCRVTAGHGRLRSGVIWEPGEHAWMVLRVRVVMADST